MHALVTGAGGFIGSHLVELLLAQDWEVTALVRYTSTGTWGWLEPQRASGSKQLQVELGDITDAPHVDRLVQGKDCVFHLAALIGIPYSYVAPAAYVATNIQGTLAVLQAAQRHQLPRLIHTSTSEVYGTARYVPIDEQHPLQGQSPYSASKIAADKLVESFHLSFGLPTVTVRPFNTYGPRQSARAVIPTIITQALHGPTIKLGSLSPIRDLTFAADTAAGFLAAAAAPTTALGQEINLGTGAAVSIGELVALICGLLGGEYQVVTDEQRLRPAGSEVLRLLSNNARAAALLNWRPRTELRDGLAQTIAWFRAHPEAVPSQEYMR